MILMKDIVREGHPALREKAVDVALPVSEEDLNTLVEMMDYIYNSVDPEIGPKYDLRPAVGLAAPQIGITKKMIAISCVDEKGKEWDLALINPKIISYSDELTYLPSGEGCLSVDREVSGLVFRPKKVKFKALVLEEKGLVERVIQLKGYPAVVFQHEFDHLKGILFPDHINQANPFEVKPNATPIEFLKDEE